MAVRNDFTAGEVLAAADLNDTFASKLDLAGGKILQIVRATDGTARSTTSTSFVDANISVTITPQKSDSAVLIIYTGNFTLSWTTEAASHRGRIQITDASNNGIPGAQEMLIGGLRFTTGADLRSNEQAATLIAYSTPATTSAVTYKVRFRSDVAAVTTELYNNFSTGQLFAIEVSA